MDNRLMVQEDNESIILVAGSDLNEQAWSSTGGDFVARVRSSSTRCAYVDLSATEWADPVPLLAILCLFAEQGTHGKQCMINLGDPKRNSNNRFLIFFARQGFLRAFLKTAAIKWCGKVRNRSEGAALEQELRQLPGAVAFDNAECIYPYIFGSETGGDRHLHDLVETLVNEAHPAVTRWLGSHSLGRALLLQRLRVILHETLDNIKEHAYPDMPTPMHWGAVYGRIRAGKPDDEREAVRWMRARSRESRLCAGLDRANVGKRPGWLEVFVVDLGVGLTTGLIKDRRSPLLNLVEKIFKEPLSRSPDREASSKTSVTGLQQIGLLLTSRDETGPFGDFVRLFSNGEWVGEHLPWQRPPLQPHHLNYFAQGYPVSPGTVFHFILDPPPDTAVRQKLLYPKAFITPSIEQLAHMRNALGGGSAAPGSTCFEDHYICENGPVAPYGNMAEGWISELTGSRVMIRPSRSMRKRALYLQVQQISNKADEPITEIAFVDVPWAAAISYAIILERQRRWRRPWSTPLTIYIVSQDWVCAAFRLDSENELLQTRPDLAATFLRETSESWGAALAAKVLRDRDSALFWGQVGDAYANEPILWTSSNSSVPRKIHGYLDLSLAVSSQRAHDAARRAMRRAIAAFANTTVFASDELVRLIVDRDYELEDEPFAADRREADIVVVASVRGTGSTIRRFAEGNRELSGLAYLVQHPEIPHELTSIDETAALRWLPPPVDTSAREPAKLFERIPNSPFVIRGGEGAIPMPRFRPGTSGTSEGSYYGEKPSDAYRRWQRLGTLRLGHWVYNRHHDLLTLALRDAIEFDADENGPMLTWFVKQIRVWKEQAGGRLILAYPQHPVADRLARILLAQPELKDVKSFPLALTRSSLRSPAIISPMTREILGRTFARDFAAGGRVVLLDDGVISGGTMTQLSQAIRGLWSVVSKRMPLEKGAQFGVSTIAIVDRTGIPIQRALVETSVKNNPRFWRWDVPTLGQEGSCPLCYALHRYADLKPRILAPNLRERLDIWFRTWSPVPIDGAQFDHGTHGRELPADDYTDICVEPGSKALEHDRIYHQSSLSRVSVAIEISRSTTRKDYPFRKADRGHHKDGSDLDVATRLEMVCSQLLLFLEDLSPTDLHERQTLILDLLWSTGEPSATSALACLSLLATRNAAPLWNKCADLVEQTGFPNQDTLLTALALHQLAGNPPLRNVSHAYWTMFELALSPVDRFRDPISRVLRVFGWGPNSFHRSPLCDLLSKGAKITRQELSQVYLLLVGCSEALRQLHADVAAGRLKTEGDAGEMRSRAEEISALMARFASAGLTAQWPESPDGGRVDAELHFEIATVLNETYTFIFGEDGMQARYRKEMIAELPADGNGGAAFHSVQRLILDGWPHNLETHPAQAPKWGGEMPDIFFVDRHRESKPTHVYLDATVRLALMELMSNVIHRAHPIHCPWPEAGQKETTADMWVGITVDHSAGMLVLELVDAAPPGGSFPHSPYTMPVVHLKNVGGSVSARQEGDWFVTDIRIPLVSTIALSSHYQ